MPITPRDKETQDSWEIGKHYTGVDATFLGSSAPYNYGFMLVKDTESPMLDMFSTDQVILNLPPRSITEEEPAATVITPTLNAGKWIERHGQIIKTINISGTTGFNYRPKLPKIARDFLPTAAIVDQEGPNSGLARFIRLRNIFRAYWEIFSNPANAEAREKNPIMLFINEKDDETWVVEPMSFRMTRQSPSNKFTYQYDITMQTITSADNISFMRDPTSLFSTLANIVAAVKNIMDYITKAIAAFSNLVAAITGFLRDLCDTFVNLATAIAIGLESFIKTGKSLADIGDYFKGGWKTVKNSFMHAYEELLLGDDAAKAQNGDVSVLGILPITIATQIAMWVARIAGRLEMFSQTFPTTWNNTVMKLYNPAYGVGGYNETIAAPLAKSGVREADITPGDDLISIAVKELGNAERFMEIAILNNLKPPYISPSQQSRLPNTLAPGDPILVPATRTGDTPKVAVKTTVFTDPVFTGTVVLSSAYTLTLDVSGKTWRKNQWAGFTIKVLDGIGAGQTAIIVGNTDSVVDVDNAWVITPPIGSTVGIYLERMDKKGPQKSANDQLLGTDLRMQDGDVSVSNDGGVSTVSGQDNMVQAILAIMSTMRKQLQSHPEWGLGIEPGRRVSPESLMAYKVAVKQALLADKRIDSVKQLRISMDGDILSLKGYVTLAGNSQPFAIDTRGGA